MLCIIRGGVQAELIEQRMQTETIIRVALIEWGHVSGLSAVQTGRRLGTVFFKNAARLLCRLDIEAEHRCPIPDGWYTLIGSSGPLGEKTWVVGRLRDDGKFEKLSVFHSCYKLRDEFTYRGEVNCWRISLC